MGSLLGRWVGGPAQDRSGEEIGSEENKRSEMSTSRTKTGRVLLIAACNSLVCRIDVLYMAESSIVLSHMDPSFSRTWILLS